MYLDLDIVMNDRHANSSLHKYVHLVMFTVQMSLCWAKPQSSKFLRGGVKEGSVDRAWIGLLGQNHLPVCPLSNFRSHRFVQNPFGYYTNLLFYLILYLALYKMLVLTCLCPKIHTPSFIGIVYIYIIIAVVFIMICILHVIYCRTITLVANVSCWL